MKSHIRVIIIYSILSIFTALLASWFWPTQPGNTKSFFYAFWAIWNVVNILFILKLALPKNQFFFNKNTSSSNVKKDLIQEVLKFPINEWDEVEKKMIELSKVNLNLQRELIEEKTKFQHFIKSFPSPVFILNTDQQIIFVNNRFREIFHFHDPLSSSIHLLQVLRDHEIEELTQNSRKFKNIQMKEVSLLPLNDQIRQYYTIFSSYLPFYGETTECVMGFLIETTEQKLTQKMREEFVANVSHEIRTPLTILMGQLQLLDRKIDKLPEAKELSQKIQFNSNRLLSMMNELLELSKLEAQGRIAKETIEIETLIESILFDLQEKYKFLNIEMLTCFDTPTAYVNLKLFDQLMLNLLENAFKYNKINGNIFIHVFEEETATKIIIKDTGIGIPEDQIHRIFERFFRVDSSRSSEIQGTGLGLSVVKHIVQKHLGQIKVQSKEELGTTFEIILPVNLT